MCDTLFEKNEIINFIKQVYKDELEISKVNDNDNFFELGGDSLSALFIMTKINETFKIDLKIRFLYIYYTPIAMSECIYRILKGEDVSYE